LYFVFSDLSGALGRSISAISSVSGKERSGVIQRSRDRVKDTDDLLHEMEILLKDMRRSGVSTSKHTEYRRQYSRYRSDLENQKKDLNRAIQRNDTTRLTGTERDQRNKVLSIDQSTTDAENSLMRSKQLLANTENIGADTSELLVSQRHQLENVNDNLHEARDLNERARRTLVGMARRVMTDRIIQYVIIFLELAIIGVIIYWKFLS